MSTDYDTSDGLFFEPVTAEEVADVIEATEADGVMVQFGGQTSVDIGHPLEQELQRRDLDCEIMGTSVDAMDLAEDRDRFNKLMDELGISQAEGGSATSKEEALDLAHDIGYPVLVRPSYVLGGRAMDVVYNDDDLETYIEEAVRVSPDKPILVDEFLADAVELDVDAVADEDDILIGGVMEHVETAGIHSGDSACMIPPRSQEIKDVMPRIREVVEDIADALDTVGLLNVQLAVRDGEVFVLEANPRSSRTVPFISKTAGVPIAKIAAKVMSGATLSELDVQEQIPEQVSVKEVVLPFDRLPGSDPRLGPEMKSTGEVMGTAGSFGKAYQKARWPSARQSRSKARPSSTCRFSASRSTSTCRTSTTTRTPTHHRRHPERRGRPRPLPRPRRAGSLRRGDRDVLLDPRERRSGAGSHQLRRPATRCPGHRRTAKDPARVGR